MNRKNGAWRLIVRSCFEPHKSAYKDVMKFIIKTLVSGIVSTQVIFFAGPKVFAAQYQHGVQRVMGVWQCVSAAGQKATLVIDKENFDLDGERTQYTVVTGAIRVQGPYGPVNYYYNFRGESLLIAFPDGARIICEKASKEAQNK
jgi:hypothetical protein